MGWVVNAPSAGTTEVGAGTEMIFKNLCCLGMFCHVYECAAMHMICREYEHAYCMEPGVHGHPIFHLFFLCGGKWGNGAQSLTM